MTLLNLVQTSTGEAFLVNPDKILIAKAVSTHVTRITFDNMLIEDVNCTLSAFCERWERAMQTEEDYAA